MTDEELIAELREWSFYDAADRIEALVERLTAAERDAQEAEALANEALARAERLEAALRVARVHVANNAEGWSVSRGAARDDLTIVDAALK